jgi:GNAT superfamily N-acetyltransferase
MPWVARVQHGVDARARLAWFVKVRQAGPGDAPLVVAILREAFSPLEDLYTPAAYAATVPSAEVVRARFPAVTTWLAEVKGKPVGTLTAKPTGTGLYLQSMAVVPAARGHGVGRALLDEAVALGRRRREDRLYLSTTPFLHDAIRLYRAAGFVLQPDEGPFALHGTPLQTWQRAL